KAAQEHAGNMAKQEKLSHTLDGKGAVERMTAAGYKGKRMAENIAYTTSGVEAAMTWWMNSPPHRANILSPEHRDVGVGVWQNTKTGALYFCQCFGTGE